VREHGCVTGLAGAEQHEHGPAVAVDEVVDLGGQPASGPTDGVVRRLGQQLCVVRPSPLRCG
jgi:hypothetical protein